MALAASDKFKKKAKTNYESAELLAQKKDFDSAANRAYYALFVALVASFEADGQSPQKYTDSSGTPYNRWRHDLVLKICEDFLPQQDKSVVEDAQDLRVQADYRPDPVVESELRRVLILIPGILDILEVPE